MSGRHRKQTTTGRTVAKVAVTGAIIGTAGVAFTGTASAAPDSDWDKLAQCESTGNWGIDTGNGFQGGLQFSPSTWTGYGGGQYAATANNASRDQQIAVAEKVLAAQGWGAWPSCSAQLGLSSGPTERSAPSAPKVEQWIPTPSAPQAAPQVAASSDASLMVFGAADNAIRAVQADGLQIAPQLMDAYNGAKAAGVDPQIAAFYQANKGLIGR
ncbi:resuscitation-promoting factor Rpf1 domain-containing protein [Antrihabitans cavernicola]|uniref:DUF3235 domain-containing protein n=1 Tax=Antrihabitans cavernicola TaxID=2495913 RepID=A0A5A7S7U6_9NOCA|nr:resuscitation-promoting factor Rpf1 domain-containing protein [Spelaeibacter cavernicola]KAA0021222.1 DUF3235 domain-containing protein [Spelaeibacter cavernicola]